MSTIDSTDVTPPKLSLDWRIVRDTRSYIVRAENPRTGDKTEITRYRFSNSHSRYRHLGSNVTSIIARKSTNDEQQEIEMRFISGGRRIGKILPSKASVLLENHWMTLFAERLLELLKSITIPFRTFEKPRRSFFFRVTTEVADGTNYDEIFSLETNALRVLADAVMMIQPGEVGLTSALLSMLEIKVEFNDADELLQYVNGLGMDKVKHKPGDSTVFPSVLYAARTLLVPLSEFSRFKDSPTYYQNDFFLRGAESSERFWRTIHFSAGTLDRVRDILKPEEMYQLAETVFSNKWNPDNFFPMYLTCLDKCLQNCLSTSANRIYKELIHNSDKEKANPVSDAIARVAVARASTRVVYETLNRKIQYKDCWFYPHGLENEVDAVLSWIPAPHNPENDNKPVRNSLRQHVIEVLETAFLIDEYISVGGESHVLNRVRERLNLVAFKAGTEAARIYEDTDDFHLPEYIACHLSSVMTRMSLCLSDTMYEITGIPVDNTSLEDFVSISDIGELVTAPVAAILSTAAYGVVHQDVL